jgi:hypothetical protein
MEALVQRLVQNPHDQEAITYAHHAGQSDPRSYAMLLEKVGTATQDPALACHWLTEAAQVWSDTLSDAHRAARALMIAIDRDPTQPAPADRLATLYRDKGDQKALVALLERRAKALSAMASQDPEMRAHIAGIHEELGRLWSEAPLSQNKKAIDNYRRAIEYDPQSQYAIYSLRELLKGSRMWADAIPYFGMEIALSDDPERQIALYRDEAEVRKQAGDISGATDALRHARSIDGGRDPSLKQQMATMVLERRQAGENLHPSELSEAAQSFLELAEEFPNEAYSYSTCALDLEPSNDRGIQLAMYYAEQAGRPADAAPRAAGYLKANPHGALAAEARALLSRAAQEGGTFDDSMLEALAPAADAPSPERVRGLLDLADALARKGKKNEAAAKYNEVLALDPANPDALTFMESHLRQTRKYADLRDVLLNAAKTPGVDTDARRGWLREIAGLCETQLRDLDTAITALKQLVALDTSDEGPKTQLKRLLERTGRWDDLATLLEQEAEQTGDVETRISMEKALAKLHEQKRKDPVAAGEAWARMANLMPDDESAVNTAVKLFERGERYDLAAQVIADNVAQVSDPSARIALLRKLGELREAAGDALGAGDAFAEAAAAASDRGLWEAAERCFARGESFEQAANAVDQRAQLSDKPREQAVLFAKAADYLTQAQDHDTAIVRNEQAADLDPNDAAIATMLEQRYTEAGRLPDLATYLLRRAEKVADKELRVALRKRVSFLQRDELNDPDAARASLVLLLEDTDDAEALTLLADDADQRGEWQDAVEYLHRLVKTLKDPTDKISIMLREARLMASGLDDAAGAIERYEQVLSELDDKNIDALNAVAELHEKLDDAKGQAGALERLLTAVHEREVRLDIAQRLGRLYEGPLDDVDSAIRVLDIIREIDPEDYDAVQRLADLCERVEEWQRVADLTRVLLEVEGDEEEVSRMTRRLAEILKNKLDKGDEALAALMDVADQGDAACREEYVKLGDELGWKGIVATKLCEWFLEAAIGPERHKALRGAFDRFIEVGRETEAAQVAQELVRTRGADRDIAERLEEVAVKLKNLDALGAAHDLLVQDLSGPSRAEELVRQAEILVNAGVEPQEAIQHGEQALASVPPDDAEALLARLAAIAVAPGHIIDLYERQVVRCKAPADRLNALARAAQVAGEHDALDRSRSFFELALGAGVQEETLAALESVAKSSDDKRGDKKLTETLAESLAAGGQGSRDGGRTRSALLRRASQLAYRDLGDIERAFKWVGDAIVTHVDDLGLDALDELSAEVGDLKRSETVLARALEEVFDGPLVRKLLARRAELRRDKLEDPKGAAGDLKRLHDLSPSDTAVTEQLLALYTELGDYRGMVALYEDMILRGKDPASRAELARKVARLWEEKLEDYREAADAWRRVLRMKQGDPEATEGLERAKSGMINKPPKPQQASVPDDKPPEKVPPTLVDQAPAAAGLALVTQPHGEAPPEEEEEDQATVPPAAPDDAAAMEETDRLLDSLKPERPDLSFPSDDESTASVSMSGLMDDTTERNASPRSAPPPPSPSAPPPPSRSAPPAPPSAPPPGWNEGDEDIPVNDDELVVNDDELLEDQ